jgi:predicted dehydrogenase
MRKIRWGLLGAGSILDRWMNGFRQVEDAEIAGIASRTPETAQKMADKYNIRNVMTYDELLKRDDIDVMYVPVPHTQHKELSIRAMERGFNVLVEKPAAVNAADWEDMVSCAKQNHVFLMEAVWTRFFPAIQKVLDEIHSGAVGDVRIVQASFNFRISDDYQGRLIDPMLAGGSLLDVGVYPLHFAQMVYGRSPLRWASLASMDTDDLHLQVDEQAAYIGQYENGALAILNSAIRTESPDTAWVFGTKGQIEIPTFWKASEYKILRDTETETCSFPIPQKVSGVVDEGYQFEIRHVQECLRSGLTESPLVPHSVTREILSQCDILRKQWGLKYPFEK